MQVKSLNNNHHMQIQENHQKIQEHKINNQNQQVENQKQLENNQQLQQQVAMATGVGLNINLMA